VEDRLRVFKNRVLKKTFWLGREKIMGNIQGVPLATEPGISLIILPLMRILQQNLKWTYLIV
jgi:hypothetical protein